MFFSGHGCPHPFSLFLRPHIFIQYGAGDVPVRGSNRGPLGGCRVSSFFWHILQNQGRFVVHHRPIRDPAVNFCLLDPLLANHLGSQDHQHEYISLHAFNPLCPGLEPATAPLALAKVCVMRLTGPAIRLFSPDKARLPTGPTLDTAQHPWT